MHGISAVGQDNSLVDPAAFLPCTHRSHPLSIYPCANTRRLRTTANRNPNQPLLTKAFVHLRRLVEIMAFEMFSQPTVVSLITALFAVSFGAVYIRFEVVTMTRMLNVDSI